MKHSITFLLTLTTIAAAGQASAQVLRPKLPRQVVVGHATPEQVEKAITAAQEFLFSQQEADGSYENGRAPAGQVGGATALVTYSLLASGVPSTEPHVARAIQYLETVDTLGVYALGLRCQVWYQLSLELDPDKPGPEYRHLEALVDHDLKLLLRGVNVGGNANGMYTYFVRNPGGAYDHSCSNYGAMGVWACAQTGADVPQSFWSAVDRGWKSHQLDGGSWGYNGAVGPNGSGTLSMTAGGLVNLFICQEYLDVNKVADCTGNEQSPQIEAAIQWLGQTLKQQGANGYTLFNLQRDGFESGYVQFGDYEWYAAGADNLVRIQAGDGSWFGTYGAPVNTAYSLSFLSLGRAPVVMNKLQYANPGNVEAGRDKFGHWHQRPRDAANVTRWIEKRLHKRLNWQVVNLSMPMEILHQSPILYIAGNEKLKFTADELAKIKRFVQEGGLVVGNADCNSKPFTEWFKSLGETLFPDYAFRPLPPGHPIFNDELFPAGVDKKTPTIIGLGNQARELFLLMAPEDPARAWQQLPLVKGDGPLRKDELYHLAGNLYYYSTERGLLRDKKKTWILPEEPPADKKLTVARIEYDGNWDPEPFGWDQMTQYLRKRQHVELDMPRIHLGVGELDTAKFRIAYLTGTGALELTDKQRQQLKRFAYEGGILIVDAAGGSAAFVKSAETELKAAFGRDVTLVPPDHDVFKIAADCTKVTYREKAKKILGGGTLTAPLLKQIEEDGKVRVFLSPLDLAVGMVGQPIDGIAGYAPDSAMALMMNMLMFGMQQK